MKKSFSLIEMLVVITIIGLITAAAAISYSVLNKNARDARRKADIEQIRGALEMFRSDNDVYNTGANYSGDCSTYITANLSTYLGTPPTDPKQNYNYYCNITASTYTVAGALEGNGYTTTCTGSAGDCGTAPSYGCTYAVGPYGKTCGP